jgi:hypothetical protein
VTLPKTLQSQGALPVIGAVAKMLEAHHDTTTNSNYIQTEPADAAAATEASPPRNSCCSKLKQQKPTR